MRIVMRLIKFIWSGITTLFKLDINDRLLGIAMILPAAVLIVVFALYPAVQGLMVSFFHVEPATLERTYRGTENYNALFHNDLFWESLVRSVKLLVITTIFQLIIGLGISLLVHQELKGRNLARGIVLFPYLVPAIVIALTWRLMLDPSLGAMRIVNNFLFDHGMIERPIALFSKPNTAFYFVIIANIWKYTPFFVIMLLARLQVIPVDQEEAAKLDGANSWQIFRFITLPWLMPVILIALLLRTIWTFNEFDMVYLFVNGGPLFGTTTLPVLVNHLAFTNREIGQAAATASIMVVALIIVSWIYFYLYARAEHELS